VYRHRIIGQVFDTYWLIEYQQELYIIDQHAAHEKVLYERTMAALQKKEMTSQMISPPIIITLSAAEQQVLEDYREVFVELGFAIAPFGGNEFALTGIPGNLFSIDPRQMFMDVLNECSHLGQRKQYDRILEKVASMSCKAAVKGNDRLSEAEARQLIDDLLSLENPYHCPHGRPTIISMTKQELEKKFKRIV
jgi:DNA mismatch repair protein MutL